MSFGPSMRQAADESQPVALRYAALRHALTFSKLGFHAAWRIAEQRFGLREGAASPAALTQAAEFFLAERKAWLSFERARVAYIRATKALGLPAPRITIERTDLNSAGVGVAHAEKHGL